MILFYRVYFDPLPQIDFRNSAIRASILRSFFFRRRDRPFPCGRVSGSHSPHHHRLLAVRPMSRPGLPTLRFLDPLGHLCLVTLSPLLFPLEGVDVIGGPAWPLATRIRTCRNRRSPVRSALSMGIHAGGQSRYIKTRRPEFERGDMTHVRKRRSIH